MVSALISISTNGRLATKTFILLSIPKPLDDQEHASCLFEPWFEVSSALQVRSFRFNGKSCPCATQYPGHSCQNQAVLTFGIIHVQPYNRRRRRRPPVAQFFSRGKSEYLFAHGIFFSKSGANSEGKKLFCRIGIPLVILEDDHGLLVGKEFFLSPEVTEQAKHLYLYGKVYNPCRRWGACGRDSRQCNAF